MSTTKLTIVYLGVEPQKFSKSSSLQIIFCIEEAKNKQKIPTI